MVGWRNFHNLGGTEPNPGPLFLNTLPFILSRLNTPLNGGTQGTKAGDEA